MEIITKPFCSIIILNYFGEKVIRDTLESLISLNYPRDSYELIVVDNNSKDKSKEIIREFTQNYKNAKAIFLKQNLGFAKGNNIGIKKARGEYVALLNNDCIVDKNWLKELVATAEKDKKIFAVNSKIILYGTNQIQNAGIMVFQDGYGRDIGALVRFHQQFYEKDYGQYNNEKEIYAACGAAVLYRRDILNKIGYLDENFFMYYEDVEISERARLNGYKIMYSPKAIVYHHHALSSKEWSASFIYNAEKGRLLHVFYHFPFRIFIYEFLIFFLAAILRSIKEIILINNYKKNLQYFKIIFYFLRKLPLLIKKRESIHKNISEELLINNFQRILTGYWYFN